MPVAPIRLFALFMGFLVLADYALCLSISFPAACLQHRWLTAARRGQQRRERRRRLAGLSIECPPAFSAAPSLSLPFASPRPSACMVDGQMMVLSTALSTPSAKTRWPSVHTCQFKSAFGNENVYIGQHAPACRWRSCLLPSHSLVGHFLLRTTPRTRCGPSTRAVWLEPLAAEER